MIDSEIEIKGLGRKHPANTHNKTSFILNFSRMSQTSCSWEKPTDERVSTHTHTHTHTHTQVLCQGVRNVSFLDNFTDALNG